MLSKFTSKNAEISTTQLSCFYLLIFYFDKLST